MNGAVAKGTRGRSPRGRVVQWLVDAIAKGELRPGDAIPTVDELAASLGVARNTAAAAVVEAERRRVVERRSPGARKRFVPMFASEAPLAASTVCVLGELGRFSEGRNAPRWSDAYLALELVPRLSLAGKHAM
ncbi:MAG: GntR family transcriptional regulator, partial [Kiritimatiellae bacterium]|nr:GntR family transcriptional regulator [Kiritimatiellia bacterium]